MQKRPFRVLIGWGERMRTSECLDQNQVPYHLATPQQDNIYIIVRTVYCQEINLLIPEKSQLFVLFVSGKINFKIKTTYFVYCMQIAAGQIQNAPAPDIASLYIFTKTADFPAFFSFFHKYNFTPKPLQLSTV